MPIQKSLEELSIQQLVDKYNFIIPEIQREYVWGNNEFNILDKFFSDIKETVDEINTNVDDARIIQSIEAKLRGANEREEESIRKIIDTYFLQKYLNIGFLYSYRPDYYVYNDRNEDVYLIDGQQRFTTLFLALFYFSLKEMENHSDFIDLFRFDDRLEKMAFDYRVRTLTHNFLIELVARCNNLDDLLNIKDKTWFLTDFADDVTIKSILKTINKLHENFKDDDKKYYQFVKKQIRFWHFRTEETSQGEELYITMNSRGQQLADNETIRAILFRDASIKTQQIEWAENWEIWQDFFWKNRIVGGNADQGFNQFLRWVNIIECFVNNTFSTKEEAEKKYKTLISETILSDNVTLSKIEPYINSLIDLKKFNDEGLFNLHYFRSNFSADWIKGIISQINLLKLLPALMFNVINSKEVINRYIRFFNNISFDSDIAKSPDTHIIDSIKLTKLFLDNNYNDVVELINFRSEFPKILSNEEVFKLSEYKKHNSSNRQQLEKIFWEAEDLKPNKGKIGHLIQVTIFQGEIKAFKFNNEFDYLSISEFDMDKFKEVFSIYSELIDNEEEIWGDFIVSEMYKKRGDRLYTDDNWFVNNALLKLVLMRKERVSEQLSDFLINIEKDFIRSFNSEDEIKNESNPKKQLYIYYILHKRLLKKWRWTKWNFGIYQGDSYPDEKSIFSNRLIYQFFNQQWRYNVGYDNSSGIWVQDNYDESRNYISELINWANN